MEAVNITVALADESHGYAISPERVPLALLSDFSSQVQSFLRGSEKEVDTNELEVSIIKGSLAFVTAPLIAPGLFRDIEILQTSQDLAILDPKRRSVVEAWQAAAKAGLSRVIRIASSGIDKIIVIDRTTDFRTIDLENWVDVERYIQGELMDLGGMKKSNAHIKLPDGSKLTVRTNKDLIRAKTDNLVYRPVHVRIRAKYNLKSGELRDASLIEFIDYAPRFDEEAFERLTNNGLKAWGDIDDPAEWVRTLRGHNE